MTTSKSNPFNTAKKLAPQMILMGAIAVLSWFSFRFTANGLSLVGAPMVDEASAMALALVIQGTYALSISWFVEHPKNSPLALVVALCLFLSQFGVISSFYQVQVGPSIVEAKIKYEEARRDVLKQVQAQARDELDNASVGWDSDLDNVHREIERQGIAELKARLGDTRASLEIATESRKRGCRSSDPRMMWRCRRMQKSESRARQRKTVLEEALEEVRETLASAREAQSPRSRMALLKEAAGKLPRGIQVQFPKVEPPDNLEAIEARIASSAEALDAPMPVFKATLDDLWVEAVERPDRRLGLSIFFGVLFDLMTIVTGALLGWFRRRGHAMSVVRDKLQARGRRRRKEPVFNLWALTSNNARKPGSESAKILHDCVKQLPDNIGGYLVEALSKIGDEDLKNLVNQCRREGTRLFYHDLSARPPVVRSILEILVAQYAAERLNDDCLCIDAPFSDAFWSLLAILWPIPVKYRASFMAEELKRRRQIIPEDVCADILDQLEHMPKSSLDALLGGDYNRKTENMEYALDGLNPRSANLLEILVDDQIAKRTQTSSGDPQAIFIEAPYVDEFRAIIARVRCTVT